MNFRILIYFLTVVRERSITKAADMLHITQPTLSRQLMQLEEDLGVKLFDRSQRRFTLTPAGSFLAQRASDIVELVEKTEHDIKDQETNLSGNICFGVGEIASVNLLAEIISAFQAKYPNVTFELFTGTTDIIHQKTEKGLIDIALLQEPIDMLNYNFLTLPCQEELGILMRADADLAAKAEVSAKDLENRSLLLPTRLQLHSLILNWLSGNISKIKLIGTCNLLGNTFPLIEHTGCYAITVKPSIADPNKFTFRPLQPPISTKVFLAWRSSAITSITVEKFIEFAKCFLGIKEAVK